MLLDESGIYRYNQLNREISPKESCNVNSICCAWEIRNQTEDCWDNIKSLYPNYKSVADKFMFFMRNESIIRELYNFYYPYDYKKWIEDKTKDSTFYSDNSTPPNEILKMLSVGFNIFMNKSNSEIYVPYTSCELIDMKTIFNYISLGIPLVSSFNCNGYGHIMTIMGSSSEGLYVYDSYGMKYFENHKRHDTNKKAILIPTQEFKSIAKGVDNRVRCVIFDRGL